MHKKQANKEANSLIADCFSSGFASVRIYSFELFCTKRRKCPKHFLVFVKKVQGRIMFHRPIHKGNRKLFYIKFSPFTILHKSCLTGSSKRALGELWQLNWHKEKMNLTECVRNGMKREWFVTGVIRSVNELVTFPRKEKIAWWEKTFKVIGRTTAMRSERKMRRKEHAAHVQIQPHKGAFLTD